MRKPIAALALLALIACSSRRELTPEQVRTLGRVTLDRAIQLFEAGRIRESWREFREAEALADDYERLTSGAEDENAMAPPRPVPPPRLGGSSSSSGGLAAQWRDEYRSRIELSWDVIRDAVREETIDISLLKGFASDYLGREGVDRVNREYRNAEPMLMQRRAQQYWFDCEGHPEVCGLAFQALRERMGERSVTESWTGNRDDYLGIVDARVDVIESVTYRGGTTAAGGFPSRVAIHLEPRAKIGGGPWSRPFSTTFDGSPPSRIERDEYGEVRRQHFEELSAHLRSELASWPEGGSTAP